MCWYAPARRPLSDLDLLTPEARITLTWDEAHEFIEPDTIAIAQWQWLEDSGRTPFEALCYAKGLDPNTLPVGTLDKLPINQKEIDREKLSELREEMVEAKRRYEEAERAWKRQMNVMHPGRYPENELVAPPPFFNHAMSLIEEHELIPATILIHPRPWHDCVAAAVRQE